MGRKLIYRAEEADQGKTAAWIMAHRLGMSKKEISRAKFRPDGICIGGIRRRATTLLQPGECLEIVLEETAGAPEADMSAGRAGQAGDACPGFPDIRYEDPDLLIVNKPAGILTHPVGCHREGTLSDQVRRYLAGKGEHSAVRSVGRLDKETSGLVVFARNRMAAARLQEQREKGEFQKVYLAAARGIFTQREGVIRLPVGKNPDRKEKARMTVQQDGQRAVTHFRVLAQNGRHAGELLTLLALRLETGRTHQIRVHMAALGHPLAGDRIYGAGKEGERALLHAWSVELKQPFTGKKVRVLAPAPADFPFDTNAAAIEAAAERED